MEEKNICPICGEELVSEGYDYDTAHIYYECPCCGWRGSDVQLMNASEEDEE